MRQEIIDVILNEVREHTSQTTAQLQDALQQSGLPSSDHRYSTLRNSYLEPLRAQGVLQLVREADPDDGGGVWEAGPAFPRQ